MTDLTSSFLSAAREGQRPTVTGILSVLTGLAREVGGAVDWEPGDEEWGRVLLGGDVVALVCARVPLVLVRLTTPAHSLLGFEVVVVNDFASQEYRVDRGLLESIFGRPLSPHVDWEGMSIDELWWATVS